MRPAVNAPRSAASDDDPLPPDHDRATRHGHLDQIYRRERAGLMRFVSARVRREDVEDIVHRAFVRLARRGSSEGIAAPGPYLRQAARNLVVDDQRLEARQEHSRHIPLDEAEPLTYNTLGGVDKMAWYRGRVG